MIRKILLTSIAVIVLATSFYLIKTSGILNREDVVVTVSGIDFCFYSKDKNNNNQYDTQYLVFNIKDNIVFGGYENNLNGKMSSFGDFYGTAEPFDPKISGRKIDSIWSIQDGGNIREERLFIEYGEGSAVVYFGDKIENQQGVFDYVDITKIIPGKTMSQIDCELLGEMQLVENYIKLNIKNLAPDKEVLGGNWYVVETEINTSLKNGFVTYEDGHIQSKASFEYSYNQSGDISISNFVKLD